MMKNDEERWWHGGGEEKLELVNPIQSNENHVVKEPPLEM